MLATAEHLVTVAFCIIITAEAEKLRCTAEKYLKELSALVEGFFSAG